MAWARITGAGLLLLAVVTAWQPASAARPRPEEVLLAQVAGLLAGSYDNIAQSRASPAHPALRLMVAPVHAPRIGDHVFYVQEMAADDARRVLAQRIYVLNAVPRREQLVMTQLDLKEPLRWRDGHLRRELFVAMLMQDLRARAGCDLLWTRKPSEKAAVKDAPAVFVATTGNGCRTASRDTGETLKVEQRIELEAETLAMAEKLRDAGGALVSADPADPFFRFTRRADAPW